LWDWDCSIVSAFLGNLLVGQTICRLKKQSTMNLPRDVFHLAGSHFPRESDWDFPSAELSLQKPSPFILDMGFTKFAVTQKETTILFKNII